MSKMKVKKNAGKKPYKPYVVQKCSSCGKLGEVDRRDLRHAARVRCTFCGGPMNWLKQA